MTEVIDAPAAVQEEWQHPYDEKIDSLSSITQPHRDRRGVFAAWWSGVTRLLKHHPRLQPSVTHTKQRFELPIERIAREHPFLIIIAMSGLS
jgi:hypothetical protein